MTIKTFVLVSIFALLLLSSVTSCKDSNSNSATSKSFEVSNFSMMDMEIVGEVFYEQSDSFYVKASGSTTLIEALKVSENNGKLSIVLKNKRKYSGGKKELVIRIGSPRLEAISFKSIGTLHLKNHFEGDQLRIDNKGVGQIIIDDCNVNVFKLTSKSVGSIEVKGTANETNIHSEGIGKIDCSKFETNKATVVSRGVGDLSIYAKEVLDLDITGLGNVNYYGNPSEVKSNITGMGKASRMDK